MKEDVPVNHQDNLIPILDTKMGIVRGQIVHHHYSKSMASLEEGCRILRNCPPDLPWDTKLAYLNKLMVRIMRAMYGYNTRRTVGTRILGKLDSNMRNFKLASRGQGHMVQDKGANYNPYLFHQLVVVQVEGPKGTRVKIVDLP